MALCPMSAQRWTLKEAGSPKPLGVLSFGKVPRGQDCGQQEVT